MESLNSKLLNLLEKLGDNEMNNFTQVIPMEYSVYSELRLRGFIKDNGRNVELTFKGTSVYDLLKDGSI